MGMIRRLAGLLCCVALVAPVRAEWFETTDAIMGTRIHAELWHEDEAAAHRLLDAVLEEMRRIDSTYSPYIEDSELSRLNREAPRGCSAAGRRVRGSGPTRPWRTHAAYVPVIWSTRCSASPSAGASAS